MPRHGQICNIKKSGLLIGDCLLHFCLVRLVRFLQPRDVLVELFRILQLSDVVRSLIDCFLQLSDVLLFLID